MTCTAQGELCQDSTRAISKISEHRVDLQERLVKALPSSLGLGFTGILSNFNLLSRHLGKTEIRTSHILGFL